MKIKIKLGNDPDPNIPEIIIGGFHVVHQRPMRAEKELREELIGWSIFPRVDIEWVKLSTIVRGKSYSSHRSDDGLK